MALTSVHVDDGVDELVATDLVVDVGARTADRTSLTGTVSTDRQTAVAQHRQRVVRRQLQTGVTIALWYAYEHRSLWLECDRTHIRGPVKLFRPFRISALPPTVAGMWFLGRQNAVQQS